MTEIEVAVELAHDAALANLAHEILRETAHLALLKELSRGFATRLTKPAEVTDRYGR